MPLLKQISPSGKIPMDSLEFHTKSISHFGLLSSTYLITQIFFLLELQINYLRCSYDIQEKIGSYVQEKWFNEWYVTCINYYHIIPMIFRKTTIYYPDRSGVGGVSFPTNSISPNDQVVKAWEYQFVLWKSHI